MSHEAELLGLCEGAIDAAVDKIHEQFSAYDTELLRLSAGEAMVNESTLVDGKWDASAELGQGLRDLPGVFEGTAR